MYGLHEGTMETRPDRISIKLITEMELEQILVSFHPISIAVLPYSSSSSLNIGGLKIYRTPDNRMMTGTKGRQVSNITD